MTIETRLLTRLGTLRQLEIFMKVAEARSIARASEALHLSHSAVSVQVHNLAEAVGLPLHEVIGKQLHLTEAGEEVAKTGHELFAVIRRLNDRLDQLKGLTGGHFRISVVSTAKYFLPHLLGPFCREYPDIDVEFIVGNRQQIIERLGQNLDDLYIFSDPPVGEDIDCYPFLPNPLAAIASRDHPLASRKQLDWADIEGEKFLMREPGSGTRRAIDRYLQEQGLKLGRTMVIESNEAIKFAVMENMGITILSAYALADAKRDGLVQLPVRGFPLMSHWHLVQLRSKKLSLIAERFLEFVTERGADLLPMQKIEQHIQRAMKGGAD
ncbi:MAG TPA: LysR family transcriptional regulator [Xanthomonadales bacterium]|nr:LysR family transcriptional regulator [Xanthomonadales bacterium]